MKRFFKPIEKEGSSKKPSPSASECSQEAEAKTKAKVEDDRKEEAKEEEEESSKGPLKFLTWNANSFLLRAKSNWPEFSKLVEKLDPDVISIQVFESLMGFFCSCFLVLRFFYGFCFFAALGDEILMDFFEFCCTLLRIDHFCFWTFVGFLCFCLWVLRFFEGFCLFILLRAGI